MTRRDSTRQGKARQNKTGPECCPVLNAPTWTKEKTRQPQVKMKTKTRTIQDNDNSRQLQDKHKTRLG